MKEMTKLSVVEFDIWKMENESTIDYPFQVCKDYNMHNSSVIFAQYVATPPLATTITRNQNAFAIINETRQLLLIFQLWMIFINTKYIMQLNLGY